MRMRIIFCGKIKREFAWLKNGIPTPAWAYYIWRYRWHHHLSSWSQLVSKEYELSKVGNHVYFGVSDQCPKNTRCGIAMRERNRHDISDGVCWYCSGCKTTKSIRESSFFSMSRIPLKKWMVVMYWWAREYPVTASMEEAEVNNHTAIDIYQWLREVCSTRLLQDPLITLGGPGKIVQIDESLFRHKPKVIFFVLYYFVFTPLIHS